MFHMMDWSPEVWFFVVIIGIISFFVITFILIYVMRTGTRNLEQGNVSTKSIKTKEINNEQPSIETKFCPECGIELEEENITYCPACGYKIL